MPIELTDSSAAAGVVPAFAALVLVTMDAGPSPYGDERRLVDGAGPRRRQDFFAGRAAAHAALAVIGRDGGAIGRGAGGEPVWPRDVVGSISHAGNLAGAVVARARDTRGLGFDIEALEPPLEPLDERFVLAGASVSDLGPATHRLARYRSKIAFSAKESVFKCLYPLTGWMLEFGDVSVLIDLDAGTYEAALDPRFCLPGLDVSALQGRLAVSVTHVFTSLCLVPVPFGG